MTGRVAIIGGGPVGMMLALDLAQHGVRSVLVNAEPETRLLPKGSTQNARTMEHYRRLGLANRVRKLGLPADYPTDVGYFTRFDGFELARIAMPSEREKQRALAADPAASLTPEPLFRCNQMYAERFLFEHLRTLDAIDLRFGWSCVDWQDLGDHVEIEIAREGQRENLTAAYLVGCDGARGIVRRKLGIRYDGETLDQAYLGGPMVNTHLRTPAFYETVRARKCWQYWAVNAEVRSNLVALDGTGEFVFTSKLRSPDEKPDPAAIARQLRASIGKDIDIEFLGHSTWIGGQAYVARDFGRGRAFLAGDAVHLFTPTGGFGMNTGVDDATNLAWKLRAVLEGWGGPKLLQSYETERRPIAYRNTAASQQLARNVGAVPVGAAIEENSPAGEAARRAASEFLATFGEEFASLGVQLGARYDGSPIIVPDGAAPPPDDPVIYRPTACPGGRAPHLFLRDGSALFDHLGRGFTLLCLRGIGEDAHPLGAAAEAMRLPLTLRALPEARDLYERDFALIRPDQHVAWRGDRIPDDARALLMRVAGW
jgi:2-polyprenyl-6-methoxyphenol hydroxylase-like FAD-dependent oxidoreductase